MKLGLSEKHFQLIVETLKQTDIDRAVVFGLRAKGNWRENSDIDIAVFGEGVNVGSLVAQLDNYLCHISLTSLIIIVLTAALCGNISTESA